MSLFKPDYKTLTDEALMRFICDSNEDAFNELYNRYSKKMLQYFIRLLNNDKDKAQDFLHDLFLKIISKPESFDRNKVFSTWIYAIATNMSRNEYRNAERRKDILIENIDLHTGTEEEKYSESFDAEIFKEKLAFEIAQLEDVQRETFILRFHEEQSIREISEIMNCSEGTVKSRIHYTLKKLTKKLKPLQF